MNFSQLLQKSLGKSQGGGMDRKKNGLNEHYSLAKYSMEKCQFAGFKSVCIYTFVHEIEFLPSQMMHCDVSP